MPRARRFLHSRVDVLVTFNRCYFLDDLDIVARSGLRIGLPGDALTWLRAVWSVE